MAFTSVDLWLLFQWIYSSCFGESVAFLGGAYDAYQGLVLTTITYGTGGRRGSGLSCLGG